MQCWAISALSQCCLTQSRINLFAVQLELDEPDPVAQGDRLSGGAVDAPAVRTRYRAHGRQPEFKLLCYHSMPKDCPPARH
jgi:hypothetical protein